MLFHGLPGFYANKRWLIIPVWRGWSGIRFINFHKSPFPVTDIIKDHCLRQKARPRGIPWQVINLRDWYETIFSFTTPPQEHLGKSDPWIIYGIQRVKKARATALSHLPSARTCPEICRSMDTPQQQQQRRQQRAAVRVRSGISVLAPLPSFSLSRISGADETRASVISSILLSRSGSVFESFFIFHSCAYNFPVHVTNQLIFICFSCFRVLVCVCVRACLFRGKRKSVWKCYLFSFGYSE